MSQEAERVYTINLGKVWLSPNNQRAKRAINMIKEFSAHHMKTEQIKIDPELSQVVWARGIRSPPRKIRVKMAKTDDGYVMVSPYEEEVKAKAEDKPKKDKKADAKAEEKVEETAEEKTEAAPKEEKKEKAKKSEAKPAKKAAKPKSKKK
ncbi:MAG: 50S ribosomal protein L31 [Nitrososphaera sp.]|nr:50S ribosomal protein L31 [Nitrososphaera sp.]